MISEELARVEKLAQELAVPLKRYGIHAHSFMVRDSMVLYVRLDTVGKFLALIKEGLRCMSAWPTVESSSTGGEREGDCANRA